MMISRQRVRTDSFQRVNPRLYVRVRKLAVWFTRNRARQIVRLLPPSCVTILDVGSGGGLLLIQLQKLLGRRCNLYGVETYEPILHMARKELSSCGMDVGFVLNGEKALCFRDNSVDGVVSEYSLHHWRYPVCMMKEICRILRPGGIAAIFDFTSQSGWAPAVIVMLRLFSWLCFFLPPVQKLTEATIESIRYAYRLDEIQMILEKAGILSGTISVTRLTAKVIIRKTSPTTVYENN